MFKFNRISIVALFTGLVSGLVIAAFLSRFVSKIVGDIILSTRGYIIGNEFPFELLRSGNQYLDMLLPGIVFGLITSWFCLYSKNKLIKIFFWITISTIVYLINYWIGFFSVLTFMDYFGKGYLGNGTFTLVIPGAIGAMMMMFAAKKIFALDDSKSILIVAISGGLMALIGIYIDSTLETDFIFVHILWQTAVAYLIGSKLLRTLSTY